MGTRAVTLTGGRKRFAGRPRPVLDGVDLTIETGEVLAILGRSGSGKSTLLRVLAGLDRLDEGEISWSGHGSGADSSAGRPRTGVVFQKPSLMPWLTVRENVRLGGRFAANTADFDHDHVDGLLDHFGLGDVADAFPTELSGGQAQRVAVIRAVSIRPTLLLLDEPFSALDPAIRADLQNWLVAVADELRCTTVLVTHDVDEAMAVGRRIVLIGEGGTVRREWSSFSDRGDDALRADILAAYRTAALVEAS